MTCIILHYTTLQRDQVKDVPKSRDKDKVCITKLK